MTIIEAIKSGKGFKRPGDVEWHPNGPNAAKRFHIETCILSKNYCDVVADDWEVEEKSIELTRSKFLKAVSETLKKRAGKYGYQFVGPTGSVSQEFDLDWFVGWADLCKELGLE